MNINENTDYIKKAITTLAKLCFERLGFGMEEEKGEFIISIKNNLDRWDTLIDKDYYLAFLFPNQEKWDNLRGDMIVSYKEIVNCLH